MTSMLGEEHSARRTIDLSSVHSSDARTTTKERVICEYICLARGPVLAFAYTKNRALTARSGGEPSCE